jgi:hypothetical protein
MHLYRAGAQASRTSESAYHVSLIAHSADIAIGRSLVKAAAQLSRPALASDKRGPGHARPAPYRIR